VPTYQLLSINTINQHEQIDLAHLDFIRDKIVKKNAFTEPVIVDQKTKVLLDGHHRLNSLIELGYSKVPVLLVDYLDNSQVHLASRRKQIKITKEKVIASALAHQLFPAKTTKHSIRGRLKGMNIPLKKLI